VRVGRDAVPCQSVAVTRWRRDRSIKWLRVDFVAPTAAAEAVLEYGGAPSSNRSSAPAANAGAFPDAVVTDSAGTQYRSVVERRTVEEQGPVKTVVRIEGRHLAPDGTALFAFAVRRHVWHGMPFSRTDYCLMNDITDREMTPVQSVNLLMPLGRDAEARVLGADGGVDVALAVGDRLLQHEDFSWEQVAGPARGKRLAGVIRLPDRQVAVRHFWEQWPISVERDAAHLVLGLCPALPDRDFYANRPDEDKLYYQIRDGLHTFRQGFSKTWEIWESPGNAQLTGPFPAASAPPEWIEQSGALRNLAVSCNDQFEGYNETLAENIGQYRQARERNREFGMMNFGDWYGERRWNWGNCEYDLGHAFFTQFARTGDARFWRHAEEAVRHQRDVDTRHFARDPRRVGQQWIHSIGHTAGYYTNDYKHMKLYAGSGWSDNRGHVWAQGMFEHYLLGGDRRSWETARLVADWAAGPQCTNFTFGNAREPGWMTKLVMSAYFATEDPFYLNAATIMLEETHRRSLATGDHGFYYHTLPKGHCNCPDNEKHAGEAGFMLGVLMTGMSMYYEATQAPWVADDIAKTAHFIADTMWSESDLAFHYTSCPKSSVSKGSTWIMLEGLAFGARHSGDPKLGDLCRRALAAAWHALPTAGKSAGYILCSSAQGLAQVAQLPGERFGDMRRAMMAILNNPVRRPVPTLVPNPDFEETIVGWPSRGWQIERDTAVKHSGSASLHIRGEVEGQNEYVNTAYDTGGAPYEITWLKPGETYRLTAWIKIDQLSKGVPPPSVRLAFRDASGTRGSVTTNSYDLARKGTWQALTADVEVPPWNTRNYIALNTNSRDPIAVDMHVDDISLVPADAQVAQTYPVLRLDPGRATCDGDLNAAPYDRFHRQPALQGSGNVQWAVNVPIDGTYRVWARLDKGTAFKSFEIDGKTVAANVDVPELGWHPLGNVILQPGTAKVTIKGIDGAVGRLVLTTDPGTSVAR
jgi:hypothetical protein